MPFVGLHLYLSRPAGVREWAASSYGSDRSAALSVTQSEEDEHWTLESGGGKGNCPMSGDPCLLAMGFSPPVFYATIAVQQGLSAELKATLADRVLIRR
jgi:hypothetical protein